MRPTRARTKRPREASLQLGTGPEGMLRRIGGTRGGRPRGGGGGAGEIPLCMPSGPNGPRGSGQCPAGSLTGAVASQRVTEAPNGPLGPGGNRPSERIGRRGPDCEADMPSRGESRAKGSYGAVWKGRGLTDKSYSGDNRLIPPKSSHRRRGLAPRCRLVASWGRSRSQGLGCSPIKAARELGSERRETVRSLSSAGAGGLRGPAPSTRGPGRKDRRSAGRPTRGAAGQRTSGREKR